MTAQEGAAKVLVLLGSPRLKGNSATLAQRIATGAEAAGAQVETIFLHGLKINPCQSCYSCQRRDSSGCAIADEMQTLYPKIIASDALVLASPVFWFTMSAQMKIFLDRCFALVAHAQLPFVGKRIAIAMTYGDTDPFTSGCINALRTFQDIFRYVGAEIIGMVYGSAMKAGEIEANTALLENARALGEKLVPRR